MDWNSINNKAPARYKSLRLVANTCYSSAITVYDLTFTCNSMGNGTVLNWVVVLSVVYTWHFWRQSFWSIPNDTGNHSLNLTPCERLGWSAGCPHRARLQALHPQRQRHGDAQVRMVSGTAALDGAGTLLPKARELVDQRRRVRAGCYPQPAGLDRRHQRLQERSPWDGDAAAGAPDHLAARERDGDRLEPALAQQVDHGPADADLDDELPM